MLTNSKPLALRSKRDWSRGLSLHQKRLQSMQGSKVRIGSETPLSSRYADICARSLSRQRSHSTIRGENFKLANRLAEIVATPSAFEVVNPKTPPRSHRHSQTLRKTLVGSTLSKTKLGQGSSTLSVRHSELKPCHSPKLELRSNTRHMVLSTWALLQSGAWTSSKALTSQFSNMGCNFDRMVCTDKQTLELNDAISNLLYTHLTEYGVLVYTDTHCIDSAAVIRVLEQGRIKYERFNLQHMTEGPELLKTLQTLTNKEHTPFVFVKEKHIKTIKELKGLVSKCK